MAVDADAAASQLTEAEPAAEVSDEPRHDTRNLLRLMAAGLVAVTVLAVLVGWLGYRTYLVRHTQQQSALFLQVGRQAAVNLTTISHTRAEADVQRILDSAAGSFHDEFQERAPAFVDVVREAQSESEGTVTAAGLESESADHAQVLVAVSVRTSTPAAPDQESRAWRMRIDVQKVGDGAKVSNVRFVP
jgi:Mce-associated membrane protein